MSSTDERGYDDQLLIRYLLGLLPDKETERLDHLSVADEEFALRLNAVENDLVDAYVGKTLSGETLDRFKSFYLSSEYRSEKVRFAETLLAYKRGTVAAQTARAEGQETSLPQEGRLLKARRWKFIPLPQLSPQWAPAAAALVLIVAGSLLLVDNLRLRRQVTGAEADRSALLEREQRLQTQLADQRSAAAGALQAPEQAHRSALNLDEIKAVSLLLLPPIRGSDRTPVISVPGGTDLVILLVALESDDFPAYRVELRDPATGHSILRSGDLNASAVGQRKAVTLSLRAGLLKPQLYLVEITGVSFHGAAELVGSYPFRAVLK